MLIIYDSLIVVCSIFLKFNFCINHKQDEENRKKREELLIQRQKRIAERSAASGSAPATTKRIPTEDKTTITSIKHKKPSIKLTPTQETKKPVLRSSTIDRLAAARINPQGSLTQKSNQPRKVTSKANGVAGTSLPQKTAGAENKKPSVNKVKLLGKKNGPNNTNGEISSYSDIQDIKEMETAVSIEVTPAHPVDKFEDIKELHRTSSLAKNEAMAISEGDYLHENSCNKNAKVISVELNNFKVDDQVISKETPVLVEDKTISDDSGDIIPKIDVRHLPASPNKELHSTASIIAANENFPISPEISEIEVSTPPPSTGMIPEPIHSRKKWLNGENSPKASKGLRKLLLFGRKSRNSPTD